MSALSVADHMRAAQVVRDEAAAREAAEIHRQRAEAQRAARAAAAAVRDRS